MSIVEILFDKKTVEVLKAIREKEKVHVRETSKESGVSPATTYRIFQKLLKEGVLKKEKIDINTVYKVNKKAEIFELLEKIFPSKKPIEFFIEKVKEMDIEEIHLIDEGENRASVLVIGNEKPRKINEKAEEVKKDKGYSIKAMVLSREQLESLEMLNLKPNTKALLFKK